MLADVRPMEGEIQISYCLMVARVFGCDVNLVESTHRDVPLRECVGQFADSCRGSKLSFEILTR